jgi:hypothetical protein
MYSETDDVAQPHWGSVTVCLFFFFLFVVDSQDSSDHFWFVVVLILPLQCHVATCGVCHE